MLEALIKKVKKILIQDTGKAQDYLLANLETNSINYDLVISQKSGLIELKKNIILGVISQEEIFLQQNQLRSRLLDTLSLLKKGDVKLEHSYEIGDKSSLIENLFVKNSSFFNFEVIEKRIGNKGELVSRDSYKQYDFNAKIRNEKLMITYSYYHLSENYLYDDERKSDIPTHIYEESTNIKLSGKVKNILQAVVDYLPQARENFDIHNLYQILLLDDEQKKPKFKYERLDTLSRQKLLQSPNSWIRFSNNYDVEYGNNHGQKINGSVHGILVPIKNIDFGTNFERQLNEYLNIH